MKQPEALRLADELRQAYGDQEYFHQFSAELRRLHHNNEVLMNALWKACGDDEQVVNDTIDSQGEFK